jgi:membrane associated rhomboid family serine protease
VHYTPPVIPLRDVIPSRTWPVVTVAIIVANLTVFWHQLGLPPEAHHALVYQYGLVPAAFDPIALVTSMFLHGGFLHIGGNMLYLWIFGDNVEDRVGHVRFVAFYLLCGVVAALAQYLVDPGSGIPIVGASGALAGIMGAYLVLYPHSRVLVLVPIPFLYVIEVPAVLFLGFWFVLQFLAGLGTLGVATAEDVGGVAFWAHVAGFVAGVIGIFFFKRPERQRIQRWYR